MKLAKYELYIVPGILFVWIGLYFWFVFQYGANIPIGDDLEMCLHFWLKYEQSTSVLEKWSLLSEQFVEHRVAYLRLMFLVLGKLGLADFRLMAFIGNLSLLGLFLIIRDLLCRVFKLSVWYLLPVAFLIFNLCYSFEGSLWIPSVATYPSVVAGGIFTIYLLCLQRTWAFWLAVFFSFITTYIFGNGQFVLLIGLVLLGLQRRWPSVLVWLGSSAGILTSYYATYIINPSRPSVIQNVLHFPKFIGYNILVFLGALVEQSESYTQVLSRQNALSLLLGLIVILSFLFVGTLFINSLLDKSSIKFLDRLTDIVFRSNPEMGFFWLGSWAFLIVTACVFAASRTDSDMLYAHLSRYRIHSVCALVLVYSFVAVYSKHRTGWLIGSSIVSLLFAGFTYFYFPYYFAENARSIQAGLHNWNHEKHWRIYRETAYWESASEIICTDFEKNAGGVYKFPKSIFDQTDHAKLPARITVDSIAATPNAQSVLRVQDETLPAVYTKPLDGVYLVLTSDQNRIVLTTTLIRNSLAGFVASGQYYKPGFTLDLTTTHLPAGTYRIGLIQRSADQNLFMDTARQLIIAPDAKPANSRSEL